MFIFPPIALVAREMFFEKYKNIAFPINTKEKYSNADCLSSNAKIAVMTTETNKGSKTAQNTPSSILWLFDLIVSHAFIQEAL